MTATVQYAVPIPRAIPKARAAAQLTVRKPLIAIPARPRVVYFGSCNNVIPVHDFPNMDFVFITPEPNHAVAKAHWPVPCYGSVLFATEALFMNAILSPLGAAWRLVQREERLWVFARGAGKDARFLRVHVNCTMTDHTPAARADIDACDAWLMGFAHENDLEAQRVFATLGLDESQRWRRLEDANNGRRRHYEPQEESWGEITATSKWALVEHDLECSECGGCACGECLCDAEYILSENSESEESSASSSSCD